MNPGAATWQWSTPFLMAAAFLVPYQELRPWEILFTYSDMLFVFGSIMLVLERGLNLRPFGSFSTLWYLAFGMMIVALLLSSVLNGGVERWPIVAGQYFFAYVILAVMIMPTDQRRWRLLASAFLAGVVIMEIVTFALYFYYEESYVELSQRVSTGFMTGSGRIGSFVGDANYHAAVIVGALPFVFYFTAMRWMPRWLAAATLGILGTALLYTASNTGLAAAAVVSLVFFFAGRIRLRAAYVGAAALAALAFIASGAPLPSTFEKRVAPALSSGNIEDAGTFVGRAELIREAWQKSNETIILGLGVDQYREFSHQRAPVHNSFLLIWTEGGFPALFGWLALIGVMGGCALLALRMRPLEAGLALSVICVFCTFSVASPHMYARIWIVPVLLAIAACFVGKNVRRAPSAQ